MIFLICNGMRIETPTPDIEVTSMMSRERTCGRRYPRKRHSDVTLAGGWAVGPWSKGGGADDIVARL
jgi:hypothetical protein